MQNDLYKFILKLLSLSLIMIIASFSMKKINFFTYKWFPISNPYPRINNTHLSRFGEINAEILFLGTSRTGLGINPKVIERKTNFTTYNLGHPGKNIKHMYGMLKNYLYENKNLKIIFIEADIMLLDSSILESSLEDFYLSYDDFDNFNEWTDYKKLRIQTTFKDFKYLTKKLLSRKTQHIRRDSIYMPPGLEDRNHSFYIQGAELVLEDKFDKSDIKHKNFQVYEKYIQYYAMMLNLCKEKNINVVFLTFPRFQDEINNHEKKYMTDLFSFFEEKEENVKYWNYMDLAEFVSDEDNAKHIWYNSSHLSYKGANKFSRILSERIEMEFF